MLDTIQFIDTTPIVGKRVLLRVDYNVSLNKKHHIANDERIRQSLPTLTHLLNQNNTLILLSHLGRPYGKDERLSLKQVAIRLQQYLPNIPVTFVPDFESLTMEITRNPQTKRVFLLENIRFFEGEETNSVAFAKQLASFGDVYVNDAFGVDHRKAASITGLPRILPSYGGLLLKKEITMLMKVIDHPQSPVVAVLGGAKVSTKITLIEKLLTFADMMLLGGGLANTFLLALGTQVGRSVVEKEEVHHAQKLITLAQQKHTRLLLPTDVIVGDHDGKQITPKLVQTLTPHDKIYDIGPQTIQTFTHALASAKTIIWNGPIGMFEVPIYEHGTQAILKAITDNTRAVSVVGGGETIAAISDEKHLEKITHISTGGGAMIEFIEKGTLPGIDALRQSDKK